jgi:hypothetical protein
MSWKRSSTERWTLVLASDQWSGHFVYVAWGKSRRGRPLYIGKSSALRARVAMHIFRAPWAGEACSFEFFRYGTPKEAADAEIAAILDLNPKYNIRRQWYTGVRTDPLVVTDEQLEIVARVQNRRPHA